MDAGVGLTKQGFQDRIETAEGALLDALQQFHHDQGETGGIAADIGRALSCLREVRKHYKP